MDSWTLDQCFKKSGSSISYTVHLSVPGLQKSPLSEPIPLPQEPKSSTQRDDWRLWVGNLDLRVTEYSLLKILQKFGSLEKFDFLYHKVGPDAGKPRGYCFVSYDNQKDAEKAMKALNGKLALSKRLAVRWAHKLEDDDVRVKDNSRDVDKTTEELSTEAKIKAIEAKLRHMDRSKEEISLTSKPVAAPGTSKYSSTQQMHGIQSHKQHSKPYMRKERKT